MTKTKMWGGRFTQGTSDLVEEYTQSVSFDCALYLHDIAGSKAHAAMLAKQGVLTSLEAATICRGLDTVQKEIESGSFTWKRELEDVHMNIESRLTELVGDVGKKLHTGRSRNDQVGLDFRLFVSAKTRDWQLHIHTLVATLVKRAEENIDVLLPGYTHLQPAQPVRLSHHLLAYAAMLQRDVARLQDADKRTRISPLGAAALAGTTYPLDPHLVAKELQMHGIFSNSMDAVSDRDYVLESVFSGCLVMMHLSRLCEDIILWANPSLGFVRLPDAYSTGSSIMPQKKNPDVAELMRGKTGRAYGSLMTLLTIMKGVPMTYNRDLQEDKEPFMDLDKTVSLSLKVMAGMMGALHFQPESMKKALLRGFLNATELADYLVGKGIAFREAHHLTGRAVAMAEEQGVGLKDMPLASLQTISPSIDETVFAVLEYTAAANRRETPGGTGRTSVLQQIEYVKKWLQHNQTDTK